MKPTPIPRKALYKSCVFTVIAGNIGQVYSGDNLLLAQTLYDQYVADSKAGIGRGANEPVNLLGDNEMLAEFIPEG